MQQQHKTKATVATMLGAVHAMHAQAVKMPEVEGMDQVACGLEDIHTSLTEILGGMSGPEALATAL